jgi:two-component system, OmpR family, sensor histidine kinase ArlS
MKWIQKFLIRLPLKYRLILVSSVLLLTLVLLTSIVQYVMLNRQLIHQEENTIRRTMTELMRYYQEKPTESPLDQIRLSQPFIDSMLQADQMIRILDSEGNNVLTLSDHLPDKWVKPSTVSQTKLISEWHETDHLLIMRSPLRMGSFQGTIEIVRNLEALDKMEDSVLAVLMLSGAGAIAVSVFGALYLVRQLIKPIRSLINTMQNIRRHGFNQRVEVPQQRDEFTKLAVMFNGMMDQVENSLQQQQQFVEDASHELRTPIAILEGHLTLINRWGKDHPEVLRDSLHASLEELTRLKSLVMELLELTRVEATGNNNIVPMVDPGMVILNWIPHFQSIHSEFSYDVHLEAWLGMSISILPRHLEQVTAILLDNAVKYSPNHKKITIEGIVQPQYMELRIQDYGIGIPAADLPHVFRRFYRADKARSREMGGSGLGLSIADRLVRLYKGSIQLESVEGQGTLAIVRFPISVNERPMNLS